MKRKNFTPKIGVHYQNQGGGVFRCICSGGLYGEYKAIMQNIKSLWTFEAHGCGMYENGTVDWDYSTGGYFAEQ